MTNIPAFTVHTRDGHKFRIFADGRIDGFPAGSLIDNRIPAMLRIAAIDAIDAANGDKPEAG